jgi:pyruvate/2-oxoglutarate/acetoin dehydrogenase E1 component
MGGRRGYGPTHSQSLEKFFIGMPGWSVVAPSPFHDPGALLRAAVADDDPVLFVENKVMYARPLRVAGTNGMIGDFHVRTTEGPYPTITLSFDPFRRADVTVIAYGGMAELAATAADNLLIQEEILCEVVIPSQIAPLAPAPILESLARTGALVCCEEGTERAGWSAEVVAMATTTAFGSLRAPPIRVAARDLPIANTSTLENATLPQVADIEAAILKAHSSPRRALTR